LTPQQTGTPHRTWWRSSTPRSPATTPPSRGTLPAVLAIGHTSGADLVAGIAGALHHLTDTTTGRSAA
jgi:hypothetical protein